MLASGVLSLRFSARVTGAGPLRVAKASVVMRAAVGTERWDSVRMESRLCGLHGCEKSKRDGSVATACGGLVEL